MDAFYPLLDVQAEQPCAVMCASMEVQGKPSSQDVRVCHSADPMVGLDGGRIVFAHYHGISTP